MKIWKLDFEIVDKQRKSKCHGSGQMQKFQATCTSFELTRTPNGATMRVELNTGHHLYISHKIEVDKLRYTLREIGFPVVAKTTIEEMLEIACKYKVPLNFEYELYEKKDGLVAIGIQLGKMGA